MVEFASRVQSRIQETRKTEFELMSNSGAVTRC